MSRHGHPPVPPVPVIPGVPAVPAVLREQYERDLQHDTRVERALLWKELACLLLVAALLVVREIWLV